MTKGMVGWAGGGSGPDFFINTYVSLLLSHNIKNASLCSPFFFEPLTFGIYVFGINHY